jgi:hypothetical protein
MPRKKTHRYSPSSLRLYLQCPHKYWFDRYTDIPSKTDYPRLCGTVVHQMVAELETKEVATDRRFYYQSLDALLGAWRFRWHMALTEAESSGRLVGKDPAQAAIFRNVGQMCLRLYWEKNLNLKTPLAAEKSFQYPWKNGVPLLGIFDQIRSVSVAQIARWRPELVVDGNLDPDYEPILIVDLKTDYPSYDIAAFRKNPSLEQWLRGQYELHESLQATCYTWLYRLVTGKYPVGFAWYHLRSGKIFFTYREERHFRDLDEVITHIADNEEALSFPKNIGFNCRSCDYLEPCLGDNYFKVSLPEEIGSAHELEKHPSRVVKKQEKQLRLKNLRAPRVKREEPEVTPLPIREIILIPTPREQEESEQNEGQEK